MASWSKRRKTLYTIVLIILVGGAVGVPGFLIFYKPATCFDRVMNGRERGVDCGGRCERMCPADFYPVEVVWSRYEKIAPGIYNIAAYVRNPNIDGEAVNVPFKMVMFDSRGIPIAEKTGKMTIPPHRNSLAFIGSVNVGESVPAASPVFEFTAKEFDWRRTIDPLQNLVIGEKTYTEEDTGSSLMVSIQNTSLDPISNFTVFAVLYDANKNAIGFSKTRIDGIAGKGSAIAPFTWPVGRKGQVISQEVLPVAE